MALNDQVLIQSFAETFPALMQKLNLFVGGIFGLYLIFFFIRYFIEKREVRLLSDIRAQLVTISNKMDAFIRRTDQEPTEKSEKSENSHKRK